MKALRTKSVERSVQDTEGPAFKLRRALGPLDLTVFEIGVVIGAGIFVLTGIAADLITLEEEKTTGRATRRTRSGCRPGP